MLHRKISEGTHEQAQTQEQLPKTAVGNFRNSTQPQPQEQPATTGKDQYGLPLLWDDPDAEFVVCSQNSHGSWNICQESQATQDFDLDPEQLISEKTSQVTPSAKNTMSSI